MSSGAAVSSEGSIGLIIQDGALTWQVADADFWLRAQGVSCPELPYVTSPYDLAFSWCGSRCPRRTLPRVSVLRTESGIWLVTGFIQTGIWSFPLCYMGQSNAKVHLDFGGWALQKIGIYTFVLLQYTNTFFQSAG